MELKIYELPRKHYFIPQVFTPEVTEILLDWFETNAPWEIIKQNFYEIAGFNIQKNITPKSIKNILFNEYLNLLSTDIQDQIHCSFLSNPQIEAHKLTKGQYVGIHCDDNQNQVRLVVQLNRHWKLEYGGCLILFNSNRLNDIGRVYIPQNNTGIIFNVGRKPYHAVSKVYSGERYSIVFIFNLA